MKSNIKSLIIISLGLMIGIFTNTSYCSAKVLDSTNQIPVTGRVIFSGNIDNNAANKDDVQGNFPIKDSFNQDKNIINIPKTGDTGIFIYLIILILAIVLLWYYRKPNEFEKEELINEETKNNSIN